MNLAARREVGALNIFRKAISLQPLLAALVGGLILLWLWIAWDAYQQARPGRRAGAGVFVLVALLFFALGWQITEIDLHKLVTEFFTRSD